MRLQILRGRRESRFGPVRRFDGAETIENVAAIRGSDAALSTGRMRVEPQPGAEWDAHDETVVGRIGLWIAPGEGDEIEPLLVPIDEIDGIPSAVEAGIHADRGVELATETNGGSTAVLGPDVGGGQA